MLQLIEAVRQAHQAYDKVDFVREVEDLVEKTAPGDIGTVRNFIGWLPRKEEKMDNHLAEWVSQLEKWNRSVNVKVVAAGRSAT